MHRAGAVVAAAALLLSCACARADERALSVSWAALGKVTLVKQKDRYVPQFPQDLAALDQAQVKLTGFMMPLDAAARQKRFLLSAVPSECGYCMPGGADQIVEVHARQGLAYVLEPVTVSGKLVLLRDDAGGLLYRLTEAVAIQK